MAENNGEVAVQDLNNNESVAEVNEVAAAEPPNNDLLDMVFALESEKQQLVEESRKRIGALRKDLEVSFFALAF